MFSPFMIAALQLVVAFAPGQGSTVQPIAARGQAGELKLGNVRMTIGELGATRAPGKLLPGDVLFIGDDITGLPIDADGTAKYTMSMDVADGAGKPIFKQDARELVDFVPLRGNVVPARAFITIGLDQDAGNYTCKITVEDPKSKAKDTLTTKFEVAKRDFGIVAVFTSHDERGLFSAPTTGVVGQSIFIQFSVATFARDPKTKQPNVEFEFQILDEKGNPTLAKPRTHIQDGGVDEKDGAFAMRFPMFLSRPGKYTVRITANDRVANKKSTYELPFTILSAN